MNDDDLEDYAAAWDAAAQRQRTEALHLEALAWDTEAALAGNHIAAESLPRYGRERTLRWLVATAMQMQKQRS